jgi:hypothetical protein
MHCRVTTPESWTTTTTRFGTGCGRSEPRCESADLPVDPHTVRVKPACRRLGRQYRDIADVLQDGPFLARRRPCIPKVSCDLRKRWCAVLGLKLYAVPILNSQNRPVAANMLASNGISY